MKNRIALFLFVGLSFFFASCGVNSHVMFKTTDDDIFVEDIPISPKDAYRLAPDDKITLLMYVEDGKRIIDVNSGINVDGGGSQTLQSGNQIHYLVRSDGKVDLPTLGLVDLAGLTIFEAEQKLRELYATNYVDPFIQVEVSNRRVIVFPGTGGDAKVIPITNNNTTLMEAIALAGGITERGKAKVIKVMRQTNQGREVYQIDLSTMDGLKYADMVVQSNDYIYVEPTRQLSREFLKEVTPITSLISSAIVIISVILTLK